MSFPSDVSTIIRTFETESLNLDTNPMSNCSRIDVSTRDFYLVQAVSSLFNLSHSSNEYKFVVGRQIFDRNRGYISLCTLSKRAGEKVNDIYMKTLKKGIYEFSRSLPQSWTTYSPKNDEEDCFTSVQQYETAISKRALDGTYSIYSYLNWLNGNKINVSRVEEDDLLAGSKKDVEGFLTYLSQTAESIQKELAVLSI
jgi:hypothetical protein